MKIRTIIKSTLQITLPDEHSASLCEHVSVCHISGLCDIHFPLTQRHWLEDWIYINPQLKILPNKTARPVYFTHNKCLITAFVANLYYNITGKAFKYELSLYVTEQLVLTFAFWPRASAPAAAAAEPSGGWRRSSGCSSPYCAAAPHWTAFLPLGLAETQGNQHLEHKHTHTQFIMILHQTCENNFNNRSSVKSGHSLWWEALGAGYLEGIKWYYTCRCWISKSSTIIL